MRTGVVLPTFSVTPGEALEVAARAEALGIDGVFCFDHLWPLGRPDRPALAPFPVLAAVAASTERVAVGTLVARVGLVPDEVLLAQFDALALLAPGRVVAGLGTGDHLSAPENEAYGVEYAPAPVRLASLRRCARELAARGIPVWIGAGGGGRPTVTAAEEDGVVVNLWGVGPERVAAQARRGEVTWAGPVPARGEGAARPAGVGPVADRMAEAGATWTVFAWPVSLEELAAVGRL